MAVTVDVTTALAQSSSGSTYTRSHAAGSSPTHAYVFIQALENDGGLATGVTYGGAAMSLIGEISLGTFNPNIQIWEKVAPAGGTQNAVMTPVFPDLIALWGVVTVNGGHASSGATVGSDATGTSTSISSSVTTTTGDLILQLSSWMNNTASSAQSGTALTQATGGFNVCRGAAQSQTGNGSVASTRTITSAAWAAISISVPQAAAAGGSTVSSAGAATNTNRGAALAAARATSAGVSTVTVRGQSSNPAAVTSAGQAAVNVRAQAATPAAVSSAGQSTVNVTTQAASAAAVSVAGASTVNIVGAEAAEGSGAVQIAGVGDAIIVGAAFAQAAVSIAGEASVNIRGTSTGGDSVIADGGIAGKSKRLRQPQTDRTIEEDDAMLVAFVQQNAELFYRTLH